MTPHEIFLSLPPMHPVEAARKCGVSRTTIKRWMIKPPKPGYSRWNSIDYAPIDAALAAGGQNDSRIAKQCGVAISTVARRRQWLARPESERETTLWHYSTVAREQPEPFVSPQDRLLLAQEAKRKRLGVSSAFFENVWLRGREGQNWLQTYEGMGV